MVEHGQHLLVFRVEEGAEDAIPDRKVAGWT